ncbi:MAG: hypothetical protein IT580_24290 [Verrucomicrobiales bacterium]|nr:hypothetical protein [Verrucomicrobiales bacterium]
MPTPRFSGPPHDRHRHRDAGSHACCSPIPRTPTGRRPSLDVHFSSRTDEWSTPPWLFDALDHEFGFTLDVCATAANARCARFFTRAEDGLRQSWAGEVCWMNPPYGAGIAAWMRKAHAATSEEDATVVALVPSRTDTRWWHEVVMHHEIRLFRGRLRFGEASTSAPFPSAVVVMRPRGFRLVSFPKVPAATPAAVEPSPSAGPLPAVTS